MHSIGTGKVLKQKFIETILKKEYGKETHYNVLTKDSYDELLKEVKLAKCVVRKTALQYRRLKRFDIYEDDEGVEKLVAVNDGSGLKYYLTVDEAYDVLETAHASLKHGGRDRMKSEIAKKYANVTFEMINLYIDLCAVCQQRKKEKKQNNRGPASNPLLEMNRICKVNLMDLRRRSDGDYKFVMVYQDLMTKYVLLQALKTDEADEVALQLNDIFLTFGAPHVVISDNGENFAHGINRAFAKVWPGLHVIPDNERSRESVERVTDRARSMISTWMEENDSENWSQGVRFVQFKMNTTFHPGIKQSPYSALFGTEPRCYPVTTALSAEVNVEHCIPMTVESEEEKSNERKRCEKCGSEKVECINGGCNKKTACVHKTGNDDVRLNFGSSTKTSRYHLSTGNGYLHVTTPVPEQQLCEPGGVLKTLLSSWLQTLLKTTSRIDIETTVEELKK